jgi:hypothetical protein
MRLGARKFTSQEGFDYVEKNSPIMKMTSLQILFALDILYDYHIHQMDIKLLHFLIGILQDIHLTQLEGFVTSISETKVRCLIKFFYELKQAHMFGMNFVIATF